MTVHDLDRLQARVQRLDIEEERWLAVLDEAPERFLSREQGDYSLSLLLAPRGNDGKRKDKKMRSDVR
jgi:hypothetical protein